MNRYRFKTTEEDWRPVTFPPVGPYWCSGESEDCSILVAYAPDEETLLKQWPEAQGIDVTEDAEIVFTGRFPRPDWWTAE